MRYITTFLIGAFLGVGCDITGNALDHAVKPSKKGGSWDCSPCLYGCSGSTCKPEPMP